ncbi:MAG: TIGR00730 family Rossman fold protein [Nitrospira sp.]|nr:TIGR00730 family Rossman fold protein [Nitrospira sp.]MDH5625378.1 TIGR00730 family Rossman fold protein [Nitrospira sp.]
MQKRQVPTVPEDEDKDKRFMDSLKKTPIPTPPHPSQRREPLPWQRPKPVEEDPEAQERIQAILESPTYREADEDVEFLQSGEARGVRLELDYLKPQLLLNRHNVERTIVVFGGTRIQEPAAAERKAAKLREAQVADPHNHELARRLHVAERLVAKSEYYIVAREFGRLVAQNGRRTTTHKLVVVTGGGPGIMEAANRGAYDIGAETVGLNIHLAHEQYPNPYITPDLCFRFHYFAIRKLHFLLRAKALVAFPGGYGTLDEIFETLALVQTRKIKPVPVVLVGEHYWRQAFNADFLVEEGVIDPEDRELFWFAETAEEIWEGIVQWYERSGEPLIPFVPVAASGPGYVGGHD